VTPPATGNKAQRSSDRFANAYLIASAVVQVALIIVVVILVIGLSDVSSRENANAITACQLANTNRTQSADLFAELLKLPPHATAAQKAQVAADLVLVRKAYALRDCGALYSTKGS
jgi:hypothetical protein